MRHTFSDESVSVFRPSLAAHDDEFLVLLIVVSVLFPGKTNQSLSQRGSCCCLLSSFLLLFFLVASTAAADLFFLMLCVTPGVPVINLSGGREAGDRKVTVGSDAWSHSIIIVTESER